MRKQRNTLLQYTNIFAFSSRWFTFSYRHRSIHHTLLCTFMPCQHVKGILHYVYAIPAEIMYRVSDVMIFVMT